MHAVGEDPARSPPGVANTDFQYPSFRHRIRGCDTKWNSY